MNGYLQRMRQDAEQIWKAALHAADAREAVRRHLERVADSLRLGDRHYRLGPQRRVWVVGAGKASAAMAAAVEELLGEDVAGGIVIVKYGHGRPLRRIETIEAAHPLPDENSVMGTARLLELITTRTGADDLLLVLLSGGGSALLEMPVTGVTLEELTSVNELLLASGADIHEINTVRKHLSAVKGGQLARAAGGTEIWTLMLSDVPGDRLDSIASGPTVPDPTTHADALAVLAKYRLLDSAPSAVAAYLHEGSAGCRPETPKAGDACFERQYHAVVGSNALACRAAADAATDLGYRVQLHAETVTGDSRQFAHERMSLAQHLFDDRRQRQFPICCISGGETTVVLSGSGKGGRNQDVVLNCVGALSELSLPAVLVSLGTDGTDGPTDAAGAVADNSTMTRHAALSTQPWQAFVDNHDSYHFFEALGDLIITGPTGTNVMDLHLLLVSQYSPRM